MSGHPVDHVLIEIGSIDKYCTSSKETATNLSVILKALYDRAVADSKKRVGPLLNLTTDGLDDETIWEQLQTRNKPLTRFATKMATRLKRRAEQTAHEDEVVEDDEDIECNDNDVDVESEDAGDSDEMSQEDQLVEDEEDEDDDDADFNEENDDYEHSDDENAEEVEEAGEDAAIGDSEDDMEAFLDKEDEKEMRRYFKEEKRDKNKADVSDDEDEEDTDELAFVQQHLYGDGSDDDEEEESGADYKFSDFFVADKAERKKSAQNSAPSSGKQFLGSKMSQKQKKSRAAAAESDEEMSEGDDEDSDNGSDRVPESDGEDGGEDWGEEGEDEDGESGGDDGDENVVEKVAVKGKSSAPTPLQQRKAALSSQISALEEELMASKPWELRGEVKAADRPENSFLSLHADIERTSKPAPIVTQAFTSSMEDMIRRRIKEGNFSDVLPPKQAKTDEPSAVEDLSQEKNKLGLGEVYAEEFLAKSLNAQPEAVSKRLEQDRIEAQDLFHKISRQLDALSHFHFTPRPVVAESRVSALQPHASAGAVSSLLLEDVTPVTAQGSSSQLAPEEVFGKKRGLEASLKSTEELTSDDRQRQRRASKAANKAKKSRELDEKAISGAATGPAAARERARADEKALDDQLRRDSRVVLTTAGPGGPASKKAKTSAAPSAGSGDVSYAKSSSFFSNLQQETANLVKKKATGNAAKPSVKNPFAHTSNSLKL